MAAERAREAAAAAAAAETAKLEQARGLRNLSPPTQTPLSALRGASTFTAGGPRDLVNARPVGGSTFEPVRKSPVELNPAPAVSEVDQAVAKARELLEGPAVETVDAYSGSIVVSDAPSANTGTDLIGPRAVEAVQQVADNTVVEATALGALSPEAQQQYRDLKAGLLAPTDVSIAGDPVAALGLQTMLLEGKLDSGETLAALSELSTQELAEGIDRRQLVADVVQELAVPESIAQHDRGTCGATAISIDLAKRNPAEYVGLIGGLASPAGVVVTAGGDTLAREPTPLADGTGRTLSQRLLAPALMDFAQGSGDYDNTIGASQYPDGHELSGLYPAQADRLIESLNGSSYEVTAGAEPAMAKLREELAAGREPLVQLDWGSGAHYVLATGLEVRDGKDYVRITNPWGREELIPADAFRTRLNDVFYPS